MRRKVLTPSERRIANLEFELGVATRAVEVAAWASKVKARLYTPPVEVRRVEYFVRPEKGYSLPTLGAWKRWVESRSGVFMLSNTLHVLCVVCGFPVPVSNGVKQRIGAHDKYTVEVGSRSKVTAGALVKWTEEETEVWNVYNPLVPDSVNITERKVVRLVTVKGLGCTECQHRMLSIRADNQKAHAVRMAAHLSKAKELEQAITDLYRINPERAIQLRKAMVLKPLPLEPTDYILVNPKDIPVEQTVEYWKEHGK